MLTKFILHKESMVVFLFFYGLFWHDHKTKYKLIIHTHKMLTLLFNLLTILKMIEKIIQYFVFTWDDTEMLELL